jgi:ubiquinone/menaquinone biosynthesis C-methylase UbiE
MTEVESVSEFGEEYFQRHLGPVPVKWVTDLLLKYMKPDEGERLLDVGCGRGYVADMFSDPARNISVVSTDVTETGRPHIRGEFHLCSMADLPFEDNSFDKIYCLDVLAHFAEGEKGIGEAFRVLRPGGKIIVATPNKYYVYYSAMVQRIRTGKWQVNYDDTARWLYSRRTLLRAFRPHPWSSIQTFYHQAAPRRFPVEWMRQTVVAVATK